MECQAIIKSKCSEGHPITRKCHDIAAALCRRCEAEARERERKRQRDYKLDQERQAKQEEYARRLAEIKDEMEHQKRLLKENVEEAERKNALSQQQRDLEDLKKKAKDWSLGGTKVKKLPSQGPTIPSKKPSGSGERSEERRVGKECPV